MNGEWKTYKIGELTSWASGGTPSKSKEEYWDGEIAWISAKTFKSNRISDSEVKITQLGLDNGSRIAPKDSILLLVRGSGLFNDIPIGIVEKPVAFNQDIKALKVNQEIIDVYFFLYWLIGNKDLLRTKLEETGIGAGKFDTEIIKSLEISLPPLNKQKIIAEIAKDLDDKIALNREMNASLEALAQTLFKEWFIKPTTEGVLPDGWREGKLGEIISFKNGKTSPLRDDIYAKYPVFGSNGIIGYSEKFNSIKGNSIIGRVGSYCGATYLTMTDSWVTDNAIIAESKTPSNIFSYILLKNQNLNNYRVGSGQPLINQTILSTIDVVIPTDTILQKFQNIAINLFEVIHQNEEQIATLTRLRDSLLPKLLRGEIVV